VATHLGVEGLDGQTRYRPDAGLCGVVPVDVEPVDLQTVLARAEVVVFDYREVVGSIIGR
jgi:hypothetical protein